MGEQRAIRYTQADIARAAKGLQQAGIKGFTIRIDPRGNIEIITGAGQPKPQRGNSCDDILDL